MRHRFRRPSPALIVALVALALAAGGGATLAVGQGPTLNGCVENTTGTLRLLVGPAAACNARETAVLVGSGPGPQGPAGPAGPAGPPPKPSDVTGTSYAEHTQAPANAFTQKPKPISRRLAKRLAKPDAKGTDAFSTYRDEPVEVSGYGPLAKRLRIVADLELPAGRWVIASKTNPVTPSFFAYSDKPYAECTLVAGSDYDRVWGSDGTLTATVVHHFLKPAKVQLRCASWAAWMAWTKITAIRVGALKNAQDES